MTLRRLTSLDAQFLALEDGRVHGHVSVLGVYASRTADGRTLDTEAIIQLVSERLAVLPPLRWRLARVPFDLEHPYWVDGTAMDVAEHVHASTLASPGDDRQLADHVAEIIAQPLDRSRPLWEIHVIDGLPDASVAVLVKLHHAAVDGVSAAEVMNILLDNSADGRTVSRSAMQAQRPAPTRTEMFGRGLASTSRHPLRTVKAASRALPYLDEVPTLRGLPGVKLLARTSRRASRLVTGEEFHAEAGSDVVVPRTRFQAPISARRSVAFTSVPLADVKAVKNHHECSINDVVVTMCASGLRTWLSEQGELPDRPLVSFVPMSVRTPEQHGTFGNRVSVMLAELPTDEPDPAKRLRRVRATMTAAKMRHRSLPSSLVEDANDLLAPAVFARAAGPAMRLGASSLLQPAVNVAISNVPGSPTTQYLAGAEQLAQFPISGVMHGAGLNITVFSYRDVLSIGIVADREQLANPWPLLDAVTDSLQELLAPIVARRDA